MEAIVDQMQRLPCALPLASANIPGMKRMKRLYEMAPE